MAEEEDFVGLRLEYDDNCGRMRGRGTGVDAVWMGCGARASGRGLLPIRFFPVVVGMLILSAVCAIHVYRRAIQCSCPFHASGGRRSSGAQSPAPFLLMDRFPQLCAHEGPRRYAHSSLAEKYFGPWSRPSESLADLSRGQPEVAGDHVSEAASTAGLCEIAPVLLGDSINFCVDAPPALRGLHCSSFIHVRKGAGNGAYLEFIWNWGGICICWYAPCVCVSVVAHAGSVEWHQESVPIRIRKALPSHIIYGTACAHHMLRKRLPAFHSCIGPYEVTP